jgi:hypothetical protein
VSFLSAALAGVLFGAGLLVSGMADPQRVLAFLDLAGHWNPALAFTMGGAIAVAAPAYALARRGRLRGVQAELPDRERIDGRLVAGSSVFGIGWGLAGICPGPGLLLLVGGSSAALLFVGGLIIGGIAAGLLAQDRQP